MSKVIEFYIPEGFSFRTKREGDAERLQVLEFPSRRPDTSHQVTWIFPEVDADLA